MFSSILKTVSGVAKAATGNVSDFRKVLGINPNLLQFALPPQVQLGLEVAKLAGLKIPSVEEVQQSVNTGVDDILKDTQIPIINTIGNTDVLDKAEDILNKIEWLY